MSRAVARPAKTATPAAAEPDSQIVRTTFHLRPAPVTDLSFVGDVQDGPRKTRRSFWNVPPTDDYGHANRVGEQYACDFLQWIKTNATVDSVPTLGYLVSQMGEAKAAMTGDNSGAHGYSAGFWSAIEQVLCVAVHHIDFHSIIQAQRDRYIAAIASRKAKKAAPRQDRAGRPS